MSRRRRWARGDRHCGACGGGCKSPNGAGTCRACGGSGLLIDAIRRAA